MKDIFKASNSWGSKLIASYEQFRNADEEGVITGDENRSQNAFK